MTSRDFTPRFGNVGSHEPHFLPVGTFPVRRGTVTIERGQTLKTGAILGRKAASGKFVLCSALGPDDTPIEDGSEKPMRILSMDVDAKDEDKRATVYVTGVYLESGVTLGRGHTIESVRDDLELRSIYLEAPSL